MFYMFKNKITILLIAFIFIGCGYRQTITQVRDVAFLKFNKSISKDYMVVVNDKYQFKLKACVVKDNSGQCHSSTQDTLYKISSGNSVIKIYDSKNHLIMNKKVYIGSSNTMEIDLQ